MGFLRRSFEVVVLAAAVAIGASGCGPSPVVSPAAVASGAVATAPETESPTFAPSGTPVAPSPSAIPPTPGPTAPTAWRIVVQALPTRLPTGTSRAVAFASGSSALLAGGLTNTGTISTVLEIALPNGPVSVAGYLAAAVHDAGGAMLNSLPFVVGGGNLAPGEVVQNLTSRVGRLPLPRADLAAVSVNGELVVVGGGTPARLDRAVLATTDGVHFKSIATLAVGVRYPAVAVVGGAIIVVGGTDGTHDRTEIQRINPATGAVRLIGRLPHGLSHAMALVIDGHLLVAGGRVGGRAQDAIFDIDPADGAARIVGSLPARMSDAAAVVIGGVGYVIGGEDAGFRRSIIEIRPG